MAVKISNAKGFIFTLQDLENPAGANNLASFAASFQRTLYKERLYPTHLPAVPRPLDSWYGSGYYGLVDRKQNSITLKPRALKQIASSPKPVFAADFVVDAFRRFSDHMANAVIVGAVSRKGNSNLIAPQVEAGYADPTRQFKKFHLALLRGFIVSFRPPPSAPINNFQTFVFYYSRFLRRMATAVPITKTNFMLSYRLNPLSSGLSLSLANQDAAADDVKYAQYVADPNFEFYSKVAKKYGFMVHKNKPWVLTADLFRDPITHFLSSYLNPDTYVQISKLNFFSAYYDRTYLTDFEDLQNILLRGYRSLVATSALYEEQTIQDDGMFDYTNKEREKYDEELLRAQLDPIQLINLYIDLRQAESDGSYTRGVVQGLRRRAYEHYHLRVPSVLTPYQRVARLVNDKYRKIIYPATFPQLTGLSLPYMRANGILAPDKKNS